MQDYNKGKKAAAELMTAVRDIIFIVEDQAEQISHLKSQNAAYKTLHDHYARIGKKERQEYLATTQLDSEREANQILTDENLRLKAELEKLLAWKTMIKTVLNANYGRLSPGAMKSLESPKTEFVFSELGLDSLSSPTKK